MDFVKYPLLGQNTTKILFEELQAAPQDKMSDQELEYIKFMKTNTFCVPQEAINFEDAEPDAYF